MTSLNGNNFKSYFYERSSLNNGWQSFTPTANYLNTLKDNHIFPLLSSIVGDKKHKSYNYQEYEYLYSQDR